MAQKKSISWDLTAETGWTSMPRKAGGETTRRHEQELLQFGAEADWEDSPLQRFTKDYKDRKHIIKTPKSQSKGRWINSVQLDFLLNDLEGCSPGGREEANADPPPSAKENWRASESLNALENLFEGMQLPYQEEQGEEILPFAPDPSLQEALYDNTTVETTRRTTPLFTPHDSASSSPSPATRDSQMCPSKEENGVRNPHRIYPYCQEDNLSLSSARKLLPSLQPWEANMEEIRVGQMLGSGTVGVSWVGVLRNKQVTVKKVHMDAKTLEPAFKEQVTQLACELSTLHHPHIAHFESICVEQEFCLALEHVGGISLHGYLHNHGNTIDLNFQLNVARHVSSAMRYLHSQGVVHGNLKPRNVIIDRNHTAKVTDFGLNIVHAELEKRHNKTMKTSSPYSAPEILAGLSFLSFQSDVYSFGILLWELFTREHPFYGVSPARLIRDIVDEEKRPDIPVCPLVISRLMLACWQADPSKRPSFEAIARVLSQPNEKIVQYDPIKVYAGGDSKMVCPQADSSAVSNKENEDAGEIARRRKDLIARIFTLLSTKDINAKMKSLEAIISIANDENNAAELLEQGVVEQMFQMVRDSNQGEEVLEVITRGICNLLKWEKMKEWVMQNNGLATILSLLYYPEKNPALLFEATKAVDLLASTYEQKELIAEGGGISCLVDMLSTESELVQTQAVTTLISLFESEKNQMEFYKANGLPSLLQLFHSNNLVLHMRLLSALSTLTNNDITAAIIKRAGIFKFYPALLQMQSVVVRVDALKSLITFAQREDLSVNLYEHGVVAALLKIYTEGDHSEVLLRWASRALKYFRIDEEQSKAAEALGGVAPLLKVLRCPYKYVRVQVLLFLRFLLKKAEYLQDMLQINGGLATLVEKMDHLYDEVKDEDATNTEDVMEAIGAGLSILSDACSNGDESTLLKVGASGVLQLIAERELLSTTQWNIQRYSTFVYSQVSGVEAGRDMIAATGPRVIARLLSLLNNENESIALYSFTCIANLCRIGYVREYLYSDLQGMKTILGYLHDPNPRIVENLLVAVSFFILDEASHEIILEHAVDSIATFLASPYEKLRTISLKIILALVARSAPARRMIRDLGGALYLQRLEACSPPNIAAACKKCLVLLQRDLK
ncbi:Protein kinase domain-containing protein [Balamuthia mandrillaris]